MKNKTRLFNLLIILVLFVSSCNLPSDADSQGEGLSLTAAAQTVEALLSATPSSGNVATATTAPITASTITPIPSPIFTSTPAATATPNCPVAQFVTDVSIPDGTVMNPNQTFNKKWRLKNIGSCAWNGYSLVFDSGDSMNGPATKAIAAVNPGQEIDIDVDLKAPATAGNYRGYWRLVTNGNVLVPIVSGYQGRSFYVDIKVSAPTNTPPPAFTVTGVTYNVSGSCGNFHISANITTNGAGTVTYYWQANGHDDFEGTYGSTLNFASAETKTTSTIDWSISASGSHYLKVYIDNPNHQFFTQTPNMICP